MLEAPFYAEVIDPDLDALFPDPREVEVEPPPEPPYGAAFNYVSVRRRVCLGVTGMPDVESKP
jgi:hypothetical protein